MEKITRSHLTALLAILVTAGLLKVILLWWNAVPFNSDEAIVALMARHILQGNKPLFFYGQAYMGSLDAFLTAAGFSLLGQKVWVIRGIQTLLYLGTIITTVWIGKIGFQSMNLGLLAGALLAVPAVNVTLYTTASLGGYGESLLIGNIILLIVLTILPSIHMDPRPSFRKLSWLFLGLGFSMGFGLWVNGLTLIYSAPAGVAALWVLFFDRRRVHRSRAVGFLVWLVLGGLIGAGPWLWHLASSGGMSAIHELFGSAVALEQTDGWIRLGNHIQSLIILGWTAALGLRPPWEVRWLGLPLMPVAVGFWLAAGWFSILQLKRGQAGPAGWILAGVAATLTSGFVFTSFGVDPSGRYFVPLAVPMALAGAGLVRRLPVPKIYKTIWVAAVLAFNLWGTLDCALRNPPGLTTQFDTTTVIDHRFDQELIDFLQKNGETRGYTNYWAAYPLAFQSEESLIFIPRLPYHTDFRYTPRDDRYPPYDRAVNESERVAYITSRNPDLDRYLRYQLREQGVGWMEETIGDYQVFYRLTRAIRPEAMGLGSGDLSVEGNWE